MYTQDARNQQRHIQRARGIGLQQMPGTTSVRMDLYARVRVMTLYIIFVSIGILNNILYAILYIYVSRWYHRSSVSEFGISKKELLRAYFLAAATIFEPDRTQERLVWAKTQIVSKMITSFVTNGTTLSLDQKTALLSQIGHNFDGLDEIIRCIFFTIHFPIKLPG